MSVNHTLVERRLLNQSYLVTLNTESMSTGKWFACINRASGHKRLQQSPFIRAGSFASLIELNLHWLKGSKSR